MQCKLVWGLTARSCYFDFGSCFHFYFEKFLAEVVTSRSCNFWKLFSFQNGRSSHKKSEVPKPEKTWKNLEKLELPKGDLNFQKMKILLVLILAALIFTMSASDHDDDNEINPFHRFVFKSYWFINIMFNFNYNIIY